MAPEYDGTPVRGRGPVAAAALAAVLAAAVLASATSVAQRGFSGDSRASSAPGAPGAPGTTYEVECTAGREDEPRCRVDLSTYVGWRVYHARCARCHAQDGLGSDFAPALGPRVLPMSWPSFLEMLERGYAGLEGAMPAWGEDRDVARYARELWTYLNARASGELPPGPVERLPEG